MALSENKQPKKRQKRVKVITKDGVEILLTPGQKEYADKKMAEPDRSLRSIAREVYPNAKDTTAGQIVQQHEKNRNIQLYTDDQIKQAVSTVQEIMVDKTVKARDRLTASFDILDRSLGKAIQRTEVASTSLTIGIDLSGLAEASDDDDMSTTSS